MIDNIFKSEQFPELSDTVDLMLSDDYKDRFVAEFYQLMIRSWKLANMIDKYERGELDNIPKHFHCNYALLKRQLRVMEEYESILADRALIEGIGVENGKET